MWNVTYKKSTEKSIKKLPKRFQEILARLIKEIEILGPQRYNWPNFGKLKGRDDEYHCHLKKSRPTYVVCWKVEKNIIAVEIYYVGTHEKAPY